MIKNVLEESHLQLIKFVYLHRLAGKTLKFKDQDITIEETTETAFEGVDIALFSAGGSTSAKYAPYAVKAGAVVVDNTSYFRQTRRTIGCSRGQCSALDAQRIIALTAQLFK